MHPPNGHQNFLYTPLLNYFVPRSLFVGSRTVLMYFSRVQMSNTSAGKLNTNVWKTENNSILKLWNSQIQSRIHIWQNVWYWNGQKLFFFFHHVYAYDAKLRKKAVKRAEPGKPGEGQHKIAAMGGGRGGGENKIFIKTFSGTFNSPFVSSVHWWFFFKRKGLISQEKMGKTNGIICPFKKRRRDILIFYFDVIQRRFRKPKNCLKCGWKALRRTWKAEKLWHGHETIQEQIFDLVCKFNWL